MTVAGCALAFAGFQGAAGPPGQPLTIPDRWPLVGVGIFVVFKILRDFEGSIAGIGFKAAGFAAFDELLLALAAIGSHRIFGRGEESQRMLAWSLGLAVFSLANIAGHRLGYSRVVEEFKSLVGMEGGRLDPPFGFGRNSSGILMAMGVLFGVCSMRDSIRQKAWPSLALAVFSIVASLLLVVLTETRSTAFPVLFFIGWLLARRAFLRRVGFAIASTAGVFVPLLGVYTSVVGFIVALLPDDLAAAISRSEDDLATFGGRTLIWMHGFNKLQREGLTLLGDGLDGRDTSDILQLEFAWDTLTNTSYHNGFLDLLFAYGAIFGVIGVGSILVAGFAAYSRIAEVSNNATDLDVNPAIGLLGAFMLFNTLESSMSFTYFWPPVLLVLCTILSRDSLVQRLSPVRSTGP